jgi:hypothetical protein
VACRVVRGGSQWIAVGRRGVGSRWVVGLGCGGSCIWVTATTQFFFGFFFLDF